MATKTKKETRREAVTRAYFEYWKLQNNPEYVKFYNEVKPLKSHPSIPDDKTGWLNSNMKRFEIWGNLGRRGTPYRKDGRRIIDPLPLVDPNKRIDWEGIKSGHFDEEIISIIGLNLFKPAEAIDFGKRFNEPLISIRVSLRYDKAEILHSVSEIIDMLKKGLRRARPLTRDQLNKIPLYAQVWELRRDRKTFPEMARQLKIPTGTVRMRYYHAYEVIYNHRYQSDLRKRIDKETLKKHCGICPDRTCRIPCPDILSYIAQDEVKRREVFAKDFDLDRLSVKRWEEQGQ